MNAFMAIMANNCENWMAIEEDYCNEFSLPRVPHLAIEMSLWASIRNGTYACLREDYCFTYSCVSSPLCRWHKFPLWKWICCGVPPPFPSKALLWFNIWNAIRTVWMPHSPNSRTLNWLSKWVWGKGFGNWKNAVRCWRW